MTIEFNEDKMQHEVKLGDLIYSVHYDMYEAHDSIREYRRLFKVGRV